MNAPATMTATREFLTSVGCPQRDPGELPGSTGRFLDGVAYRVEIPEQLAVSGAREQVRRAAIGLAPLNRYGGAATGGRHD